MKNPGIPGVVDRARQLRQAIGVRAAALRNPAPHPVTPPTTGSRRDLILGGNPQGMAVTISERGRLEHAHVIGTTGSGKSTFLEHCIRQDVINGRGVCVVDPHGEHPDSLYRSTLGWLKQSGYAGARTVHLIDPNAPSGIAGFNPLARPDADTDLSVIAGLCLEAFERAWGNEDTQTKPTIRRVLKATFTALAECELTLAEATLLYDPDDPHGIRSWVIGTVQDRYAKQELQRLHQLGHDSKRDFRMEVIGPINRLAEFVSSDAIRTIIGQREPVLDMREAMDEGHIILANLSGGARVYEGDADLLGRLLTRLLFFHAKRRKKPHTPFVVYLDECHRYLSGDLESILAEARKYGVAAVLAHQWLAQLEAESANMLAAVKSATNLKVIFRLKDHAEAEELAQMVVPLDLEMPVSNLVKPTVVGHQRVRLANESTSEQHSRTITQAQSRGTSSTDFESYGRSYAESVSEGVSLSRSNTTSFAVGTSQAAMTGTGTGMTTVQGMTPPDRLGSLDAPTIFSHAEGASNMAHAGMSIGTSSTRGASSGITIGTNSARAITTGESWSRGTSTGQSDTRSSGTADSTGAASTRGCQETFESLYEDLPATVHSKDNVLYLAAQTLRSLPTGKAFVSFVDRGGAHAVLVTVPPVAPCAPPVDIFDSLRRHILEASPSALPLQSARQRIDNRERTLIEYGLRARIPCEPESSAGYRVKKARIEETAPENGAATDPPQAPTTPPRPRRK